ncbi:nucleotidyltransferase family protein [Tomitella cavernea]|uniref:Nucleotidyltransferase family protein n=1 Tax=Tomitella cavernea TaxID=1387982 RepID=A0ABP9CPH7_9ACTN|nr:nucleotidyltransferase family protein [Tomitella cavernea]
MISVAGVVLAAGRGSRFGRPKALARLDGEAMVARAARTLAHGGCAPVVVVLGAAADEASALVPPDARTVFAADWAAGLAASLRAGLRALPAGAGAPDAALIHLADLPDVGPDVVARLLESAQRAPDPSGVLARATYGGRPGHPVLVGRRHWADLAASVTGDRGAGPWLHRRTDVLLVACDDLATGDDADTADALRRHGRVT